MCYRLGQLSIMMSLSVAKRARGIALLVVLLVMGFLSTLLASQVQQSGFVALFLESTIREARLAHQAEAIAMRLQSMPLSVAQLPHELAAWQPLQKDPVVVCGREASYLSPSCSGEQWLWYWRLLPSPATAIFGEDAQAWSLPQQHWTLIVRVKSSQHERQWRFQYQQRLLP